MKKAEIFFDAITNIREELVEQALDHRFRRRVSWQRYLSAAACLVLVVTVGFGALRLGIFGGFGGNAKNEANGAMAPESSGNFAADDVTQSDAVPEEPAAWPGDTAADEPAGEPADEPAEEPAEGPAEEPDEDGGATLRTFDGEIVEVREGCLLVEPIEGSWILASADLIEVPVENTGEFQPGHVVTVAFSGEVMETYPAQINGVESVTAAQK